MGSRTEFRRALATSTIHDFYQLARAAYLFPARADLAPAGTTQRGADRRAVRHRLAARPGPL
jgi:hypothetical protein